MDAFDLTRFHKAHEAKYQAALKEIKDGKKKTHWMWYIFPQIAGLGTSEKSVYYSLKSVDEAKAYMNDEILGEHMNEICGALINLDKRDATEIFGFIDDCKLQSSMTIFKIAEPENGIFQKVLDKFYNGVCDAKTIEIVKKSQ